MGRPPMLCPTGHLLRPRRFLVGSITCSCGRHESIPPGEPSGVGAGHPATMGLADGFVPFGNVALAVQRALGHSSAATYSHLWPDANDRTRKPLGSYLTNLSGLPRTYCG